MLDEAEGVKSNGGSKPLGHTGKEEEEDKKDDAVYVEALGYVWKERHKPRHGQNC